MGYTLGHGDGLHAHSLHAEQPQAAELLMGQTAPDLYHQDGTGPGAFHLRFGFGQFVKQLVLHRRHSRDEVKEPVHQGEVVVIVAASGPFGGVIVTVRSELPFHKLVLTGKRGAGQQDRPCHSYVDDGIFLALVLRIITFSIEHFPFLRFDYFRWFAKSNRRAGNGSGGN